MIQNTKSKLSCYMKELFPLKVDDTIVLLSFNRFNVSFIDIADIIVRIFHEMF